MTLYLIRNFSNCMLACYLKVKRKCMLVKLTKNIKGKVY